MDVIDSRPRRNGTVRRRRKCRRCETKVSTEEIPIGEGDRAAGKRAAVRTALRRMVGEGNALLGLLGPPGSAVGEDILCEECSEPMDLDKIHVREGARHWCSGCAVEFHLRGRL